MKCDFCEKDLDEHQFLSLRKYNNPDKTEGLEGSVNFCSEKCIDEFLGLDDDYFKSFDKYLISRCGAYRDCERIDNLRKMCEGADLLSVYNHPFSLGVPMRELQPHCEPGEVGIIRVSAKLMDILEAFDTKYQESSNEMLEHSKNMNKLTKWILGFTFLNLVFIIISIVIAVTRF